MKGYISEDALAQYSKLAAEKEGLDFSEGETYDFARCMRSDGSFYGTRGKCKKGKEAADADPVEKARGKVSEAKASGDKKKLADARHDQQIAERTRKIENEAKKRGVSVDDVIKERNARSEAKVQARLSKEQEERVKRLQDMASKGDKKAMDILKRLRDAGRIGKEPGFGPGAKARQETKESKELGAKPAGKPRASASELKASQEKLFDDAKAKRATAREAEKEAKRVAKETKDDKSPEARKKRLEAGRAWDKANTAADSAQRKWMKEHERWSKASGREERAKMSPEQRKEERRIDRIIKEQG